MENKLWANAINSHGIWFSEPQIMTYDPDTELYWDKEGNFDVSCEGFYSDEDHSYCYFAHPDRDRVATWTHGANSMLKMLPSSKF